MGYDINEFNLDFFSLKGKVAIVTGGNSGLGQAYALAMAKAGADIFCASYVEDNGETKELIEGCGRRFEFMKADISVQGVPKQIAEECVARFGHIDILVNCAGILLEDDVLNFDRDKWDPMIAINLTAAFELSHEVAKFMIPQRSGKIINICSLFSFLGGLRSPAYASMKHGLAGLTKAYADELGKYNIQVNGIAPGYFATNVTKFTRADPVRNQRVLDHIPADRWGERQDLMGGCVYLASKASDYVTGTLLVIDGGYRVR